MGLLEDTRNRVAELIDPTEDDPEPEGYSADPRGGDVIEGGFLEHDPPKDLDDYWNIYQMVGPVRHAINNFASEVVEPGWYITCENDETAEELTEYFTRVGMLNTDLGRDAGELMERMVIEREVRGTVFLEKVTDDRGRHQGLYPLQNKTITIYTKPGKNILPAPDEERVQQYDDHSRSRDDKPVTAQNDTAAYVQYDDTDPHWDANVEVGFTRNEVIKFVRDADVGDARGTSRVKAIADRAQGLLQKLNDNDDAIESKAYPQILFQMGTEDNPWSKQEVQTFMDNYSGDRLQPGTMTAVSGDVDIKEFAGDTADIYETLNFDINMIISGLPGPVYATGGFSQNVAPAVAQAQERNYIKEVKKTRRELETVLTDYAREVADSHNLEAADTVAFNVGRPQGDVAPEDVNGSIIRYESDSDGGGQVSGGGPTVPISSSDIVRDPVREPGSSGEEPDDNSDSGDTTDDTETESEQSTTVTPSGFAMNEAAERIDRDTATLADPRLVSTTEAESELTDEIASVFDDALSESLNDFERRFSDTTVSGSAQFEQTALRGAQDVLDSASIERDAADTLEAVVANTLDTLSQPNHDPELDVSMGVRHRQQVDQYAQSVRMQVGQAVDEMMDAVTTQVQRAATHGRTADEIADRVRTEYDESTLTNRARVIARMEVQNAVNSTKLSAYERSSKVAGYRIINPCNEHTTRLCTELAGCDTDPTDVLFDEGDVVAQLDASVSDDLLFDGFDPIPAVPPFHYGCRSEIVAIPGETQ